MFVKRQMERELRDAAAEYPVVTILGPRQSGKSTLARLVFPNKPLRRLEDPDTRLLAADDPRGFLADIPDGAVLDEIQRVPELLSYLQGSVDDDDRPGRFVLTGSHQPELQQAVSQTLAGRTAVLTLLPFSYAEMRHYRENWDPFELAVLGSYPRLHQHKLKRDRFFSGYLQTYVERDVRALINLHDLDRFQVFLRLLAGRGGQVLNYTSLSNDIGVSSTTVKSWIAVLKASFVVFELPPFFENIRKRVIKSPKLFFYDVGLASYLLGIESADHFKRDPLRGNLYENLVVLEVLKACLNQGMPGDLFFYRDTHGNEVDLIIRRGRTLHTVEVKSAATFTPGHLKGIAQFRSAVGDSCGPPRVCYNGDREFHYQDAWIHNPFLSGGFDKLALVE